MASAAAAPRVKPEGAGLNLKPLIIILHGNILEEKGAPSVFDISDLISDSSPVGSNAIAIQVPKSKRMGGHLTTKGVSKIRVGKECRPQYAAEDDSMVWTEPPTASRFW